MGNLTGRDGSLPDGYYEKQIRLTHLQHKRMSELEMKPIVPAFAGIVPPVLKEALLSLWDSVYSSFTDHPATAIRFVGTIFPVGIRRTTPPNSWMRSTYSPLVPIKLPEVISTRPI